MYNCISPPQSSKAEKQQCGLKLVLKTVSLACLAFTMVFLYSAYSTEFRGPALVQLLNNKPLPWTAGMNNISGRSPCWSEELLKARRPSKREASLFRLPSISLLEEPHIPTSYDFRDEQPFCHSPQDICSPSWVDTVASAASDRLCVASGASVRARLWAPEVTACCSLCQGPLHAWLYLTVRGFPENHQGCRKENASCKGNAVLLEGLGEQCANRSSSDRHYGVSAFLLAKSVEIIQLEMIRNGPVVAVLDVYLDLFYYSSGVYQYNYGSYQGSMAVKVIGWGRESGLDYWLAVTSLGDLWGDRGMFKIRRGVDECGMEADVTAGLMLPT